MRLAGQTGLPVSDLLDLDDDSLDALAEVARESTWKEDTELLASLLETLQVIAQRLESGVPVVMVERAERFKPQQIPRPEWIRQPEPQVKSVSPAELFRRLAKAK